MKKVLLLCAALVADAALAQSIDIVDDPGATPCVKDGDCALGYVCADRPRLRPRWACTPGCRSEAPRCPPRTTCREDIRGVWWRCKTSEGINTP